MSHKLGWRSLVKGLTEFDMGTKSCKFLDKFVHEFNAALCKAADKERRNLKNVVAKRRISTSNDQPIFSDEESVEEFRRQQTVGCYDSGDDRRQIFISILEDSSETLPELAWVIENFGTETSCLEMYCIVQGWTVGAISVFMEFSALLIHMSLAAELLVDYDCLESKFNSPLICNFFKFARQSGEHWLKHQSYYPMFGPYHNITTDYLFSVLARCVVLIDPHGTRKADVLRHLAKAVLGAFPIAMRNSYMQGNLPVTT